MFERVDPARGRPLRVAHRLATVAALAGVMLAVACAPSQVQTAEVRTSYRLPRPDRILVSDFTISAHDVVLDQAVGSRILRTVENQPSSSQELQVARAAQAAVASALVANLRKFGLPAERAGTASLTGNNLLVQGQIIDIDQGNRTRRTLIGFGSGKSSMAADAQLLYAAHATRPETLITFQSNADSGRMPGIALPIGVGAAAERAAASAVVSGGVHTASETRNASGDPDADRLADALAHRIATFAALQGWIPSPPER